MIQRKSDISVPIVLFFVQGDRKKNYEEDVDKLEQWYYDLHPGKYV